MSDRSKSRKWSSTENGNSNFFSDVLFYCQVKQSEFCQCLFRYYCTPALFVENILLLGYVIKAHLHAHKVA